MNPEEVDFLFNLLKIYSPSGSEDSIAEFIERTIAEHDCDRLRRDKAGNVIAEWGSGKPVVLLCGHMDTVEGMLEPKEVDGVVMGRGAVDAKASLAAMIMAGKRVGKKLERGHLVVAAVVDEEGAGLGVKALSEDQLRYDYAVFGEPSGSKAITIGYKGRIGLRLLCETKTGHASAPWLFTNSILELLQLHNTIKTDLEKREPDRSPYRSVTVCLTKIKGGIHSNTVPPNCEADLDIRVPIGKSCEGIIARLKDLIDEENQGEKRFSVNIVDFTEPYEVETSSPPVRAFTRAILKGSGLRPKLLRKTGTGDMNFFARKLSISAISYGPGDSKLSHTKEEAVSKSEYLESIDVYENAVLDLLRARS